jgi:endonuclease YncB( thermonuclease family)
MIGLAGCGPDVRDLEKGEAVTIAKVEDGDTVTLADGRRLHLTGIEGPHRGWPLEQEARTALEQLAQGRQAQLYYGPGVTKTLDDGALLAELFVTTESGRQVWAQEEMIRQGLARAHSWADNATRADRLLAAEAKARAAGLGLWADPFYAIRDAATMPDTEGYQIVEGVPLSVEARDDRTYLNFGADMYTDFTIAIPAQAVAGLGAERAPEALKGQKIRVRGYVASRGGPLMTVDHPAQIELLGPAPGQATAG